MHGKEDRLRGIGNDGIPDGCQPEGSSFDVIGHDAFKGVDEKASVAGLTMAQTLREVADQADKTTVSMVRDDPQNVEILFGEGGLSSGRTKGKTIIVMSAPDPERMSGRAKKVEAENDLKLVSDAVNGGASADQDNTLSIMTSGDEESVKSFTPCFDAMGSSTLYYGESPGNSKVAELVSNMILGIMMNTVTEWLKLGEHDKLPEKQISNLLKVSTADSWVVPNCSDVENGTAKTALGVSLKDLTSAFIEGVRYDVALPFNALAVTQRFASMGKENLYAAGPVQVWALPACRPYQLLMLCSSATGPTSTPSRGAVGRYFTNSPPRAWSPARIKIAATKIYS